MPVKFIMNVVKDSAPLATLGSYHLLSLFRSQDTQNQLDFFKQEIQNQKQEIQNQKQEIQNQKQEINLLKKKWFLF